MKTPRFSRASSFAVAVASLLAAGVGQATDYYWTAGGTSGTLGGSGDWQATGKWAEKLTDTTYVEPVGDWVDDGFAYFTNANGTITMDSDVSAAGIYFNVGQTINGSGILTIGAQGITASISDARISTQIIATDLGFLLTNSTLTLSGDNTDVTGVSAINFGGTTRIMQLASANALGNSDVTLTALIEAGGKLYLGDNSTADISYNTNSLTTGSGTSLVAANKGVSTWTGSVSSALYNTTFGTIENAAAQLVVNGDVALSNKTLTAATSNTSLGIEINGIISGSGTGAITTSGTQRLALGGVNTFSGTLNLTQNTAQLALTNVDALKAATLDTKNSGTQTVTFEVAGTNTYNIGALTGGDDLAIGANTLSIGAKNSATTYSGIMSGTGGGLTKVGSSTLTLTSANTYSGSTSINRGSLLLTTGNDRINTAGSMVIGSASYTGKLILGTSTLAANQTLAGLTATGQGGSVVGANATTNSVLTLNIASGTNTYGGILGGTLTNENKLALTKTGSGTLALTSANTYSGNTIVSAGTLAVNNTTNSGTGTGTVTVGGAGCSSTPTLAGTGTINGATTIAAAGGGVAGTYSPGSLLTNNGIGTQTFGSTLTYETGSIFEWQLNSNTVSGRGTNFDGVNIAFSALDETHLTTNANLTISSDAIFSLVLGGTVSFGTGGTAAGKDTWWNQDRSWRVFDDMGSNLYSTTSNFTIDAPTASYTPYYPSGSFSFNNTNGTLNWTAVPEPSSALAGMLLGAGLLRRRRK